ncbi:MAG TPA: 50S ribosomal protein L22 [Vulgatibacter sp.]|nr:50S ribosomal protein L22 [Vulgatibacter sp.]
MAKSKNELPSASAARLRHLRLAPRKVRAVCDVIRGQQVERALATLQFTPKAAAAPVAKLIRSAIANAEQKSEGRIDVDRLFVKRIMVDEGPTLRRFRPRAQGRATRINKKTSHVTVELAEMR